MVIKLNDGTEAVTQGGLVWFYYAGGSIEISHCLEIYRGSTLSLQDKIERVAGELADLMSPAAKAA